MNVRELVTVLKFKTDPATIKAAESAVARIKDTMSKIRPQNISMKVNTAPAYKQLDNIQTKLNSISRGKTVKVQLNAGGVEKRIDNLNRKLDRMTGQKKLTVQTDTTGIDKAIGKLNELDRTQQKVTRGFYKAKTQGYINGKTEKQKSPKAERTQPSGMGIVGGLKGAFVALGGYALINEIKQTADAMMSLSSRIKIVTKDDAERLKIEQQLYAMANKNRSSLEDLGDLYYKTALASKRFGASQEDVLKLTDIVSKSLVIGGADVAQQKATILQLSQALGSGVLQGDELRSLRENAPILMDAIATYFNTDVGGLKEMGAKGLLTTEKLMQAILASGDAVNSKFAQITPTIGQAMTVLGNKFSKLILDIQNSTGVFGKIAGFILQAVDMVGQAIDFVVKEFGTATPEMMGMIEDFKALWESLQPLVKALGTIFMNWVVPALKMFGRIAASVLGMVAQLLQPIADFLGKIADLIATISNGLPGILKGFDNMISKAESGALQQYRNYMTENNQTNNITVSSRQEANDFVADAYPRDFSYAE